MPLLPSHSSWDSLRFIPVGSSRAWDLTRCCLLLGDVPLSKLHPQRYQTLISLRPALCCVAFYMSRPIEKWFPSTSAPIPRSTMCSESSTTMDKQKFCNPSRGLISAPCVEPSQEFCLGDVFGPSRRTYVSMLIAPIVGFRGRC